MVMWAMGITNSYTLEASAAGSNLRVRTGSHYRARDFELIGQRFCEALLEYVDTSPLKVRLLVEVDQDLRHILLSFFSKNERGSDVVTSGPVSH